MAYNEVVTHVTEVDFDKVKEFDDSRYVYARTRQDGVPLTKEELGKIATLNECVSE